MEETGRQFLGNETGSSGPQKAARDALISMREERGWSQSELARQLQPQTTPSQIRKLETGDLTISLDWMERFARAFGVTMSAFLPLAEVSPTDTNTAKLLDVLKEVPATLRPTLVKAAADMLNLAMHLGSAERGPALRGDHHLAQGIADIWNSRSDTQRRRIVEMLQAADGMATG